MKKTISEISSQRIIIGYIAAVSVITVLAMILATLVLNAVLPEKMINTGVYVILFTAGLIGSLIAAKGEHGGVAIRVAIVGASLILSMLAICILLFDARVGHWVANGLCTLAGCAVACTMCIRGREIQA